MKILLSGVETNNKGAELMLYAILQEIERKYPDAAVFIPKDRVRQGLDYVKTSLNFQFCDYRFIDRLIRKFHVNGILRRLHLPQIYPVLSLPDELKFFIDGSGFLFSDQWNLQKHWVENWKKLLKSLHSYGTRVIFLPQAFGPAEQENTKEVFAVLSEYADVIMPREKVSYNYIKESRKVSMKKVKLFTDFTSLVDGVIPEKITHLKNGICVIPNVRMIDKGAVTKDDYKRLLSSIIVEGQKNGHPVYLLNHEGKGDEQLALELQKEFSNSIEVVTGLNALEVKGMISTAYVVVSSRFHGVASALNCCVPCLATSWSHKYKELFSYYNIESCILPLDDIGKAAEMVGNFMDIDINLKIRELLAVKVPKIKDETRKMWYEVWRE